MSPRDTDAIRRTAIAAHAEAWRFLEMPERTPADDATMIAAARQSLDLWKEVGTAVNEQRGLWLLARACISAGQADEALQLALETLRVTHIHARELHDFDIAFAEEVAARAHAQIGNRAQALTHYARARTLGEAITDEDDRRVFFEQLQAEPWFGIEIADPTG
jgi:hypothetical protein